MIRANKLVSFAIKPTVSNLLTLVMDCSCSGIGLVAYLQFASYSDMTSEVRHLCDFGGICAIGDFRSEKTTFT